MPDVEQLVDNRYRILRPLGSGGMADVYLAHDDVLDRDIALKVMSERYAYDAEFVERFRREAQSAAALSHTNIVSVFDRGESEDGTYYMAMEYLPGGTLKDRILKRGALPPRTAAAVALQIAEALQAAHHAGVVHRDIKPHNVLITDGGDVKVGDFGIARAASSSTMTKTGSILGTAHYISPEQAMGEPVGPASDLYSLGVVLYEMLTGTLPFDAETPIGIAMKHVNGRLVPPNEVNPAVPEGLNAITARLLEKNREDRYADAAELMEDLERVLEGLDPASATTRVMRRSAKPAAAPTTRVGTPPLFRSPRKDDPRKRRAWVPILLAALALLALLGGLAYAALDRPEAPPEEVAVAATTLDVPDLVGYSMDEAREEVGEDFRIEVGAREESPEPEGTILSQSPGANATAEEGSTITVDVSGTQTADVPDVTGESRAEAVRTLERAGFEVDEEAEESSAANEGYVTDQDPGGGETVEAGSEVTITVGEGPDSVEVPNLYNSTLNEARQALQSADLSLGSTSQAPSDQVSEGRIISQQPGANAEADPGSSVNVTVSSGPREIEVPDVVGYEVEDAMQIIGDAGFGYETETVQSDEPAGTVVATDPEAGTSLDPYTTSVTIQHSAGPPPSPPTPQADDRAEESQAVESDVPNQVESKAENSGGAGKAEGKAESKAESKAEGKVNGKAKEEGKGND